MSELFGGKMVDTPELGVFTTFWGVTLPNPPLYRGSLLFESTDALYFWVRFGCFLSDLWAD